MELVATIAYKGNCINIYKEKEETLFLVSELAIAMGLKIECIHSLIMPINRANVVVLNTFDIIRIGKSRRVTQSVAVNKAGLLDFIMLYGSIGKLELTGIIIHELESLQNQINTDVHTLDKKYFDIFKCM